MIMAVCATVCGRTPAEVPNVHLNDSTRYTSDPDGVLSAAAVARVDSLLGDVWRRTTAEPVVVFVDDLSGQDIDSYATDLFGLWGLGKRDRDNGVLILVSRNDRQAAIRTGYGVEGILNDARCGRIIRQVMAPAFKDGDYDRGITDAVTVINQAMTHPDAVDELLSKYANNAGASSDDDDDSFRIYLILCGVVAAGMLLVLLWTVIANRRRPRYERYTAVNRLEVPYLALTFLTLGFGLLPYLLSMLTRRIIRETPGKCPNCGHKMHRLDEQADNAYLTPAQDLEERINSVDYDVWLCPQCGEMDILPYVNRRKNYGKCDLCGARAAFLESDRVMAQPTTQHPGMGVRTYRCLHCDRRYDKKYTIPKLAAAAPPIIIGGHGGGFGGGSFGGGMTGGGGASGGW